MPDKVKIAKFDTSWHPDATETAYIYQFGTQWVLTGGPRYVMPGATEIKFVEENGLPTVNQLLSVNGYRPSAPS
jgi:acetate kinase